MAESVSDHIDRVAVRDNDSSIESDGVAGSGVNEKESVNVFVADSSSDLVLRELLSDDVTVGVIEMVTLPDADSYDVGDVDGVYFDTVLESSSVTVSDASRLKDARVTVSDNVVLTEFHESDISTDCDSVNVDE